MNHKELVKMVWPSGGLFSKRADGRVTLLEEVNDAAVVHEACRVLRESIDCEKTRIEISFRPTREPGATGSLGHAVNIAEVMPDLAEYLAARTKEIETVVANKLRDYMGEAQKKVKEKAALLGQTGDVI